jgi:hypothetical protein
MKTASLLFAVVGFGGLTLGISLADSATEQESSDDHLIGDHPANPAPTHQAGGNNDQANVKHPSSSAGSHTPEKLRQAGSIKTLSPAANTAAASAKAGSLTSQPRNTGTQSVRPPVAGETTVLGPGMFRKPAGVTASLGGLTASSIKTSTAGINGTEMKRTIYW